MASSRHARINARLDETTQRKVEYIQRKTKRGVSEIVVASLDLYYKSLKGEETRAKDILSRAGFVGCGTAPEDLSENYKELLRASLGAKT